MRDRQIARQTDRLSPQSPVVGVSGVDVDVGLVYEPYLAGAQDEKQYRVVKDRDRWFNVVMGSPMELDEASTDRTASRVELPDALAHRLALDLSIAGNGEPQGS
jgi:hypothetical protein